MSVDTNQLESERSSAKLANRWLDQTNDHSFERTVTTEPKLHSWMIIAAGAVVPLGLAGAALATTYLSNQPQVATTAWIAVAIVGSASVISSAAVSHRRSVTVDRENDRNRSRGNAHDAIRSKVD